MNTLKKLPALPLDEWEPTKKTLHRYVQIVGKIRMALMPPQNHWWHVPLYVTTRGIGTASIPYKNQRLEITFDFIDHRLRVLTSGGCDESFDLHHKLSVADFYKKLLKIMLALDIHPNIVGKPYDLTPSTPFAEDKKHHHYDRPYVEKYWIILQKVDQLFRQFNSEYYGKVCPVQLYWHSFDLAVTRFSGNEAPPMPGAGRVDREAYSHEVISFGFWPGDTRIPHPAFYSYTFPAPEALRSSPLQPEEAHWIDQNQSPLALLYYEDARKSPNTEQAIMNFLQSAYKAGAKTARWDVAKLEHLKEQAG